MSDTQGKLSSPFRALAFRLFYMGTIGSALGYTMQATLSSWLMATLTTSTLMVALVQTASTLPALLFGLIAGALSDIANRRNIILITQAVMMLAVATLGLASLSGLITPIALLLVTFLVGCGFAFYVPAQQASVNDFVARADLANAVALGAVAFNVARAIGPALAGAIAVAYSPASALLLSSVFFTAMIVAALNWPQHELKNAETPERLFAGVLIGMRFAWHSETMRAVIVRNCTFSLCASAFWALLPVIARDLLMLDAAGFGVLSAGFGGGAIVGALSIPYQLKRTSLNNIVTFGFVTWAISIALISMTSLTAVALVGAAGCGVSWVCVLATLAAGTQSSVPAWVRARAVSMTLVSTQASLAAGSLIWGFIATHAGLRVSLATSACAILLGLFFTRHRHVKLGTEADVSLRVQLLDMAICVEPRPDDGPVLIQLEYRINPASRQDFLRTIELVGQTRRRSGAESWRIFRDLEEENRYFERYVVASWAGYLRQRARMTMADSEVQQTILQYQMQGIPVRISRLIGVDAGFRSQADQA